MYLYVCVWRSASICRRPWWLGKGVWSSGVGGIDSCKLPTWTSGRKASALDWGTILPAPTQTFCIIPFHLLSACWLLLFLDCTTLNLINTVQCLFVKCLLSWTNCSSVLYQLEYTFLKGRGGCFLLSSPVLSPRKWVIRKVSIQFLLLKSCSYWLLGLRCSDQILSVQKEFLVGAGDIIQWYSVPQHPK